MTQIFDSAGNVTTRADDLGDVIEASVSETPIFLGPSEIYTVDPKRPFYGTLDYTIELENQYPKKFSGKLDDKTLEQLRELAKDLAETALKVAVPPTAAIPEKEAGRTVSLDRRLLDKKVSFILVNLTTGESEIISF